MPATLTIDMASEPGSWARAIAHTPHLAAMVAGGDHETMGARRCAHAGEAGVHSPRSPASPGWDSGERQALDLACGR